MTGFRTGNIEYGFKAFTGKVWRDDQVDSYNALSAEIEGRQALGWDCDHLANARHNLFCCYSDTPFFAVH